MKGAYNASISTHAPAGGATNFTAARRIENADFYSRPCGRGDAVLEDEAGALLVDFYSRPCGRGDGNRTHTAISGGLFLLTPLREGRLMRSGQLSRRSFISTHAPAGGATELVGVAARDLVISTHAPAGGATPSIRSSTR